jgi:hypothetical protein
LLFKAKIDGSETISKAPCCFKRFKLAPKASPDFKFNFFTSIPKSVEASSILFEPYFTTKHASAGTGLGLYMSKMIINNSMKGFIVAKNCNDGVCFTITIPQLKSEKEEQ